MAATRKLKIKVPGGTALQRIFHEVTGLMLRRENRTILAIWLGCVAVVILLGMHVQTQSSTFLGIAESKEIVINFEHPAVGQRILVIPGQSVSRGDLIAEVDQPELDMKIHGVRAHIARLQAEKNLRTEMSRLSMVERSGKRVDSRLEASIDPLTSEIRALTQELSVLEGRERGLYVFAEISGVIGNVNYKKGETVAPYAPLITISPAAPTFVQGYVHESLQSRFVMGQKVKVRSVLDSSHEVEGRIIGLASRVSELPIRMLRVQGHKLWGREITIEIPSNNPFLLGERVEVGPSTSFLSFPIARAEDSMLASSAVKPQLSPRPIAVPESIRVRSAFEPSGAIYLRDLKKFLVVSDDTDDADSPFLFMMNPDGSVDSSLVQIEGIERIQDPESISQDENGDIYVMGSQSRSHSGKLKHDRKLFVRVKQRGLQFNATGSVLLRDLIIAAARESREKEINLLVADFDKELEIESHYIDGGELFVGLKTPLDKEGQGLILGLGKVEQIFATNKIAPESLKIAHRIAFPATEKRSNRIAEIIRVGEQLVIATTSKSAGSVGRLWTLALDSEKLTLLGEFPEQNPEGLAYDSSTKELLVLFDEGNEPALFTKFVGFGAD